MYLTDEIIDVRCDINSAITGNMKTRKAVYLVHRVSLKWLFVSRMYTVAQISTYSTEQNVHDVDLTHARSGFFIPV